jgi:hypothetical protein
MTAGEQLPPEGEKVESPPLASADPSPPSQPQLEPEPEPAPEPDPAAIAAEAEKLKEQGNESFKRTRYGEAIDLYTKAISASSVHLSSLSVIHYHRFPALKVY